MAHNVKCEFSLDEQRLVLDEMFGANYPFESDRLGPAAPTIHSFHVRVFEYGPTTAKCRSVCDEVGESNGVIRFNVPKREPK